MSEPSREPIVIVRDEASLYTLRGSAIELPAKIILDRREKERRRGDDDTSVERRRSDRRRVSVDDKLARDGYAIVQPPVVRVDPDEALA